MKSRTIRRQAFTLVELMIVIAIIGLLLAMLTAGIWMAIKKGKQTRNRVDITQLEVALEQFKQRFGDYPPSRIKLCESYAYYDLSTNAAGQPNNQLDYDSVQFLTKMFPRMDISSWASVGIHWNGNASFGGVPAGFVQGQDAPGAVTLEGDQCLVFFLGGIPGTGPSCLGFAADPKNPANPSSADRIGPFFEFTTSRLVALRAGIVTPWAGANTYYSYADTFSSTDGQGTLLAGAPYAYFSCYKVRNGYNRYNNFTPPGTYTPAIPFGVSDCYTTLTVSPYLQTTSQWQKPTSFQILSAGADGFFGNAGGTSAALWGGIWTPQTAATVYPQGSSGYDDQANFTSGLLGAGAD